MRLEVTLNISKHRYVTSEMEGGGADGLGDRDMQRWETDRQTDRCCRAKESRPPWSPRVNRVLIVISRWTVQVGGRGPHDDVNTLNTGFIIAAA